jgi:hypothetical protein
MKSPTAVTLDGAIRLRTYRYLAAEAEKVVITMRAVQGTAYPAPLPPYLRRHPARAPWVTVREGGRTSRQHEDTTQIE